MAISSQSAFGEDFTVNPEDYLRNGDYGVPSKLDTVYIYGGFENVGDWAKIGTAFVYSGFLWNNCHATVDRVYLSEPVNSDYTSTVYNIATIGEATVIGGQFWNMDAYDEYDASSEGSCGFVRWLGISGGEVINESTIGNLSTQSSRSSGGTVQNYNRIDSVTMNGGVINNSGQIGNMNYGSGTYDGTSGTIGTLTVTGTLNASGNWGTVTNLNFDGGSILFAVGIDGLFSSFNASNINLAGGNILFDLTTLGNFGDDLAAYFLGTFGNSDNGFRLTSLFGGNSFDFDGLDSFTLIGAGGVTFDMLASENWDYSDGTFVYLGNGGGGDDPPSNTPEPATLLVLGLGAIGAGFVARRRR